MSTLMIGTDDMNIVDCNWQCQCLWL